MSHCNVRENREEGEMSPVIERRVRCPTVIERRVRYPTERGG